MAKFAKGDKVVSVKSGAKGVVDEVYGEEKYAVLFDGAANPDKVEGSQIKANAAPASANPVVQNAINARSARNLRLVPFDPNAVKVGDSVWYKGREFEYRGMRGTGNVRLSDVFDGEEETVFAYDRNLKMSANAMAARNATKLMTLVPSKDGSKLNDFTHYAYFTADGEWKEGDIPYVRKDMLIHGLERELEKAKTTMQAISDAIKQAKEI